MNRLVCYTNRSKMWKLERKAKSSTLEGEIFDEKSATLTTASTSSSGKQATVGMTMVNSLEWNVCFLMPNIIKHD